MIEWLWRLGKHIEYMGHLPINPRLMFIDGEGKEHWEVECAICGKIYESITEITKNHYIQNGVSNNDR